MPISSALGSSALLPAGLGFRNLIINGAMQVDQRKTATTAITTNGYTTDLWLVEDGCSAVLSSQQSTDVPTGQGFDKSLKVTATTAEPSVTTSEFSVITHFIEGTNSAQLAWGTSGAKSIAVSFWVKATVTGTYSFTLYNDGASRVCPNAYTVNASNTWEKKTIIITGDVSGTWLTTTGRGVVINFYTVMASNLLGTSGVWNSSSVYGVTGQANAFATVGNIFAITGVQLEQNYQPTPFEQRPIGVELALCQRYYEVQRSVTFLMHYSGTATNIIYTKPFIVQKRATPIATNVVNNYNVNTRNFGVYDALNWYHGGAVASGSATGNYQDDLTCFFSAEL